MVRNLWRWLMKLNDFFDKSSKPKSANKVITVVNEIKENELQAQISDLEKEVERLHLVDGEKDSFNQGMQSAEIRLKESLENVDKLIYEKALLEEEVKSISNLQMVKQDLENELRDVKGQLGTQGSSLEQAQKNNLNLSANVTSLTQTLEALQKDEAALRITLEEYNQKISANKHDFQEFKKQFDEIVENFQRTKVKYKEISIKNGELSQHVDYWKRASYTLQDEKDHLEKTREALRDLATTMEEENIEYKGVSKIKQAELKNLKDTVKTMAVHMDNLVDDNKHLAGLCAGLKEELARPRYMSMSAIERTEGFKMPMGGSRTHYLGQGKPTLLTFKNGGSENDN